jgi:hypothetical protein
MRAWLKLMYVPGESIMFTPEATAVEHRPRRKLLTALSRATSDEEHAVSTL